MSLLSKINGLRGENLCSAVLAHLLLRSPEAREHVIRLISDNAPRGPIYVRNQFAVFREEAAYSDEQGGDASSKRGRVDLVIETDDAVIGIENKFNAPFQEGQPAGYLGLLRNRSEQLSRMRGRPFTHALMVLAPVGREAEVRARFKEQQLEDAEFLSWEGLLCGLNQVDPSSPVDAFLIRELTQYAESELGSTHDLARLLPHLTRAWAPRGTTTQRAFMNTFVWSLLDEGVKSNGRYQSGSGNSYYGFYLRPGNVHANDELWIGFVERCGSTDSAALAVCMLGGQERLPTGPYLKPASAPPGWSEHGWSCAEIEFDRSEAWHDLQRWTEALKPVNDLIQAIATDGPAEARPWCTMTAIPEVQSG